MDKNQDTTNEKRNTTLWNQAVSQLKFGNMQNGL